MNKSLLTKIQKYGTYIFLILAVIAFVYALGFITKFYGLYLYYNRNKEILNYYFDALQPFNKDIFNVAILLIIFSLLFFIFEFNKYIVGLVGITLCLGTTLYTIINSILFINRLNGLKGRYLEFELTNSKKYTASTITFDLGNVLFISLVIVSLIILLSVCINFYLKIKTRGMNQNESI